MKVLGTAMAIALTATTASAAMPSYDCRKAKTADEIAICTNDMLAANDWQMFFGWSIYKRVVGSKIANAVARVHLRERHHCGADFLCINEVQADAICFYVDAGVLGPEQCL